MNDTQQLSLVIGAARELGLAEILIICDRNNIASAKTARACGGSVIGENVYNGIEQVKYMIETGLFRTI